MAFDEFLAERIRASLKKESGITEQRAFGGLAFMLDGNMVCGVIGERMMLRLGEEGTAAALEEESVVPMDFTGRVIKTMVFVEPEGMEGAADLSRHIEKALVFTRALPKK